jgi:hypothetical protein
MEFRRRLKWVRTATQQTSHDRRTPDDPQATHSLARIAAPLGRPGDWDALSYEIRWGKSYARAPDAVGYERDFITADPEGAEARWKEIEDRIPATLGAVAQSDEPLDAEVVRTVKQMIALHWSRSLTAGYLDKLLRPLAVQESRRQILAEYPVELASDFYQQYRILPAGHETLTWHEERRPRVEDPALDRFFLERMVENYDMAMDRLERQAVEMLAADGDAEFVLSDFVTLTANRDRAVGGPLKGVPWNQATTILMPLGPRYLASIGPAPVRDTLAATEVERINRFLVHSSWERVFYRPSLELAAWLVETRPAEPSNSPKETR